MMILFLILLIGGGLRAWGIRSGLPYGFNPDEMVIVTSAMRFGAGDLNPHRFDWPSGMMYMTFGLYGGIFGGGKVLGVFPSMAQFKALYFTDLTLFLLSGRIMVVIFSLGCIVLTYIIGRRILGFGAGLAAAAILAVSALSVTMGRSLTPDEPATFFSLLSLLFAIDIMRTGRGRSYILSGLFAGLAIGAKYNAGPILVALPLAHVIRVRRSREGIKGLSRWHRFSTCAPSAWIFAGLGAAPLGFIIFTPYAILDFGNFSKGISYQFGHVGQAGHIGAEVSNAFVFHLTQSLAGYWGWPLLILSFLGALWVLIRGRDEIRLVLAVLVIEFLFFGRLRIGFPRYMAPLMPLFCLMIGSLMTIDFIKQKLWGTLALVAIIVVCAIPTLLRTISLNTIASRTDTRVLAREWILSHPEIVPPDSEIGVEWYPPPLPENRKSLEWKLQRAKETGEGGERFAFLLEDLPDKGYEIIETGVNVNGPAENSEDKKRICDFSPGRDPVQQNPAIAQIMKGKIRFVIFDSLSADRFSNAEPDRCLVRLQNEFYDFVYIHGTPVRESFDSDNSHPGPIIKIIRLN